MDVSNNRKGEYYLHIMKEPYILLIGDFMKQKWIEATYEWIDEFTHQRDYLRYRELADELSKNVEVQQRVDAFIKSQEKYLECKKYGQYHPDLQRYQKQFQKDKQDLYMHPMVQEYKILEKQIQSQLDDVSKQIAQSISSKVKHPNAIGLLSKHR
jgi:cell fate (sporulation/competence/biofilm development) regulator YlbF (YheA/YmcA/DUF963 family)